MKILLLTTFFPPANSVATHRMFSFAQYLPEFGLDVDVITVSRPGDLRWMPTRARVIRLYTDKTPVNRFVPSKRRLRQLYYLTGLRPLRNYYLTPFSRAFIRYVKETGIGGVDAVLASYGPESVLRAAEWLHDHHQIPLVADFRDPWFGNRYYAWTPAETALVRLLQTRILKKATLVTTVSRTLADQIKSLSKNIDPVVIYNGFFEKYSSDDDAPADRTNNKEMVVCYCGSLYAGLQPIDIFLKGLSQAPNARLNLALLDQVDLQFAANLSQQFNVRSRVNLLGTLDYEASLMLQRNAEVLLFLNRTDGVAKEVLTGKLFEYFATGNFILGIGHPEDEAAKLIREYGNGVYVSTPEQVAEVLNHLQRFKKKPENMDYYSRRNQARILAEHINDALR